jgi:hypothetical protein
MNPLPYNSIPSTRVPARFESAWDSDVTFSEAAFCDFTAWMDEELVNLELNFQAFVTVRSKKRSFGR